MVSEYSTSYRQLLLEVLE